MKWQMIQCAGAIDVCHISVRPPALNHTDHYNGKAGIPLSFKLLWMTNISSET